MSTSHDSKIEVTIKLVVDIETESHPGDIPDDLFKDILTDNVADTLAQYNDEDIKAAITEYRVIETEMRE